MHDAPRERPPASFAVLYVHGWTDYFFNREMAEAFTALGGEFYAVDMHASGRSLRPHQDPGYVSELEAYFPDLDAATAFITTTHPGMPIVVLAHSQGGLTVPLWAAERAARAENNGADDGSAPHGLILNGPWLEQAWSRLTRPLLTPIGEVWGRVMPRARIPIKSPRLYERVISTEHGGEFPINDEWRPDTAAPAQLGWARAVLRAQNRLARGLGLTIPTLAITSHASLVRSVWREEMRNVDIVTDVSATWRQVPRLGRNFEIVKVRGALHDVLLSEGSARERAYSEIGLWLSRHGFTDR